MLYNVTPKRKNNRGNVVLVVAALLGIAAGGAIAWMSRPVVENKIVIEQLAEIKAARAILQKGIEQAGVIFAETVKKTGSSAPLLGQIHFGYEQDSPYAVTFLPTLQPELVRCIVAASSGIEQQLAEIYLTVDAQKRVVQLAQRPYVRQ